jgi:hypothetical protein
MNFIIGELDAQDNVVTGNETQVLKFLKEKQYAKALKYSEKNVEIFFFVNYDKKEYIAFLNERRNIKHISTQYTNFYEPYLLTNISFKGEVKPKKYNVKNSSFIAFAFNYFLNFIRF